MATPMFSPSRRSPACGQPALLRVAAGHAYLPSGEIVDLGSDALPLPPGRRLAVLGPRRPKQALAAVLSGLVPYSGSVTLNGVELRDMAGADIREVVQWRRPGMPGAGHVPGIVLLDEPQPDEAIAGQLAAAGGRTVLLLAARAYLPGADPVLRHFDEVITLG